MKLIADLHLHSKYSRAVSQQMVIPEIANWAKKKGINLVGAPDWTHPLQLRELKENLVETAEGIFSARTEPKINFLLATEISSIYSQGGKTRRIHNLMVSPSFETVEKIMLDQMQYLLGEYIKKGKLEGYYLSPGSSWFDIFSDKTYLCLKKPWF